MKLLHLTPKKHLNSIQKNGLIPTKIKHNKHLDTFQEDGLKNDKCIYMWTPYKEQSTDKLIKDFIYCKNFIHPRNDIYNDDYYGKWTDYTKMSNKLYGDDEDYLLLEIDRNDVDIFHHTYYHAQLSSTNKYCTTFMMNTKYEHDDKFIVIGTHTIKWKYINVVAEISSRIYKNNTIGVSYKKIK